MFIYGFSEILAHISVELDLEHRWLVWHYTNKTVPSLNFWQRSHESILCAWKDKKSLVFNRDAVREPYTDNFIKGYKGKNRKLDQIVAVVFLKKGHPLQLMKLMKKVLCQETY